MRLAAALGALALGAGGITVTALPRPPFPGPVVNAPAPHRLVPVSSGYHEPALGEGFGVKGTFPSELRRAELVAAAGPFAFYGGDAASARYLLAPGRYAFDFQNYAYPPKIAPGEREFVYEQIVWAREADGVLYVENAHSTYAKSSYGRNAYITAIDLQTKKRLWRSAALVASAQTFVLAGDYLVSGYGFTDERDDLYLLDRNTGRVVDRLLLPSAPERIIRRGNLLHVRTYDHDVVVRLRED